MFDYFTWCAGTTIRLGLIGIFIIASDQTLRSRFGITIGRMRIYCWRSL
jgi:hypothetical protein